LRHHHLRHILNQKLKERVKRRILVRNIIRTHFSLLIPVSSRGVIPLFPVFNRSRPHNPRNRKPFNLTAKSKAVGKPLSRISFKYSQLHNFAVSLHALSYTKSAQIHAAHSHTPHYFCAPAVLTAFGLAVKIPRFSFSLSRNRFSFSFSRNRFSLSRNRFSFYRNRFSFYRNRFSFYRIRFSFYRIRLSFCRIRLSIYHTRFSFSRNR
jgi:hypothetical protein